MALVTRNIGSAYVNSPAEINRFEGDWEFLSNYCPAPVKFDGELYPSVEHAYQAAKTIDASIREKIRRAPTPAEAKRLGRKHINRPNWEEVKLPTLRWLVAQKFSEPKLATRLLATGNALLVEGNNWGDTFWGQYKGVGENHMGRILMDLRARLRPGTADTVIRMAWANLPTKFGMGLFVLYTDAAGSQTAVQVVGDVSGGEDVLVRVHSACLTGDIMGSIRCDCGEQRDLALQTIHAAGQGVFIYMIHHEGRGIGLTAKTFAYDLQDTKGLDTVDANRALGMPVDARDYAKAAAILHDMGVKSIQLLSNNPGKESSLSEHGITVASCVPLRVKPGAANHCYLSTKRDRLGHDLPHLPEQASDDTDTEGTT